MRTKEERQAGLDSLWYEIHMFVEVYKLLPSEIKTVEDHSHFETFLLHTRNLIEFLTQKGGDDLITANQFAIGIDNYELKLPKDNDGFEINNYLSHLTWGRITGESPNWDCDGIKEEITKKLKDFISKICDDNFPTEDGRNKEDFLNLLE